MEKKIFVSLAALAVLMMSVMAAQQSSAHQRGQSLQSAHSTTSAKPDKALMQRIWTAWSTLDPAKAAPFYDKQPNDVFFDIAPLKYKGWASYAKGAANLPFSSAKFTVNDDARVGSGANGALGIATVDAVLTGKDGKTQHMTIRWTVVWENKGGQWLIIHEHVSVPMG